MYLYRCGRSREPLQGPRPTPPSSAGSKRKKWGRNRLDLMASYHKLSACRRIIVYAQVGCWHPPASAGEPTSKRTGKAKQRAIALLIALPKAVSYRTKQGEPRFSTLPHAFPSFSTHPSELSIISSPYARGNALIALQDGDNIAHACRKLGP